MNRSTRKLALPETEGWASGLRLADPPVPSSYFIFLVILIVTSVSSPYAEAAQASSQNTPGSQMGELHIRVPAGMTGDDYWVYVNGQIESAPPRKTARHTVTATPMEDGWEIWDQKGLLLSMQNESSRLRSGYLYSEPEPALPCSLSLHNSCPLTSSLEDPRQLFDSLKLSRPAGKYTVDVAIVSTGAHRSFPFVITHKYVIDLPAGHSATFIVGVPNDWSDQPVPAEAARECDISSLQDVRLLGGQLKAYSDDPMVKALNGVDASLLADPDGVVVLNLPPAQGGTREFDGRQIGHIAHAIRNNHYIGSHEEVARCQSRFPEFSKAYTELDRTITFIDNDLAEYRKLLPIIKSDPPWIHRRGQH